MTFGKKDQLIGLDIGSSAIKVAEVADTKNGYALKRFGLYDMPSGAIEEGVIRDPEEVAETIREALRAYNIKTPNAAISIGGYSVVVKKINVQTMTEEALQSTIHFEAEQYIPFDISDVNLDFQIMGESEHNPNQMSVLLVAAKKEMIADYVNVLEMAGLASCIVDVDAFALQNIYELGYMGPDATGEEFVALIDVGASKTSLNILKGRSSLFMRDVSLGCGQTNLKISSLLDCSPDEAEEIKLNNNGERISNEELKDIESAVIADWCTEISRALDFFYSTYPEERIQKILISGGGGNITDFKKMLALRTSTEVETIDPFKSVDLGEGRIDDDYLKQMAPQAAICMGLAIRKVNDK
ncbi:type IV pilus biogenesis protein PilM [Desulfoluna spongiiphila]|uniref:type IV pilus biogenesis protein PilM n=1 Tax=Desulfoluna spongiiphila TaxID=419481 RepID=UPI0012585E7E|nr:type IV pilus assembly protein PilM [Desulfoluna spongiiphila]VVS92691.1 type iv pilus assembly protein pilm [Desulfoluna spongiiphila]